LLDLLTRAGAPPAIVPLAEFLDGSAGLTIATLEQGGPAGQASRASEQELSGSRRGALATAAWPGSGIHHP
jgi:hypothetical protein